MFKDRTTSGVFNTLSTCTASGIATDPIVDDNTFDATGTSVKSPCGMALETRKRVYWYKEFD